MMKKLLTMVLLTFVLFALAACGDNGDTATTSTPEAQEPSTIQNESVTADGASNAPVSSNDGNLALDTLFHTGEGMALEVIVHSNFSIVTLDTQETINRIVDGEQVSDRVSEFIKFPVTLINPTDESNGLGSFLVLSPYADQEARHASANPFALHPVQARVIQRFDENHAHISPVPAGTTLETNIFIPFVGDGNYILVFGGTQVQFLDVAIYQ